MDGFTAKRDFRGTTYHIEVENPDHVEKGIASVTVDGNAFEEILFLWTLAKRGSR